LYVEEVWIPLEGYPNYAVSNFGDVKNVRSDQILRHRPDGKGYLRVSLSNEGVVRDHYIHHLVAKCFFGRYEDGEQINWVNGDITDNFVGNLRLRKAARQAILDMAPPREDARAWGKRVRVLETGAIYRTVRDCARHIRGDHSTIYACLRGERKTHRGYSFEYWE
jgi:hypothetical protein